MKDEITTLSQKIEIIEQKADFRALVKATENLITKENQL